MKDDKDFKSLLESILKDLPKNISDISISNDDILYFCGGYEGIKEVLIKKQYDKIYQFSVMFQVSYETFLLIMIRILLEVERKKLKKRILKRDKNITYVDFGKESF